MFKDTIASMNISILPTTALVLFLLVFVGVVIWSFRKGSKEVYETISNNALNDGTKK